MSKTSFRQVGEKIKTKAIIHCHIYFLKKMSYFYYTYLQLTLTLKGLPKV
jgi:hypothetical protein